MLDQKDYFKLNNGYLTRSKIRDYEICPRYFKGKHILGTIVDDQKQAFEIGTGVDTLLAQIECSKDYVMFEGDRRTKAGKEAWQAIVDSGKVPLAVAAYEEIMGLSCAVDETDAYKELKDHEKQKLLQVEMDLGPHFHGLAALPDYFKIEDRKAILTDLKTAQTVNPRKYYHHCLEYSYFTQFAVETIIIKALNLADYFEYRHLVVEKMKNIWNVETFKLGLSDVNKEITRVEGILAKIKNDKEFKKYNPSFASMKLITDPSLSI